MGVSSLLNFINYVCLVFYYGIKSFIFCQYEAFLKRAQNWILTSILSNVLQWWCGNECNKTLICKYIAKKKNFYLWHEWKCRVFSNNLFLLYVWQGRRMVHSNIYFLYYTYGSVEDLVLMRSSDWGGVNVCLGYNSETSN